jgi:hypothetical protein
MTKELFWKIMSETSIASGKNAAIQQGLLEQRLNELAPDEIIEYDAIFQELVNDAYDWKLWAAAYIINGGCSDDGFMDFRGWLVGQGEAVYTKALADPDSLSELEQLDGDYNWEGYGYLAFMAYEQKTGKQMPLRQNTTYNSEPKGEAWEEEELSTLLPKLSKKHAWL